MSNEVKFKYGDSSAYEAKNATGNIDTSTIYFVSNINVNDNNHNNTGTIYKGTKPLGTTRADHLKTVESIQIAGGPFADIITEMNEDWPWIDESGNNIIPAGKSIHEILETLFLKVIDGSVAWGPIAWKPYIGSPTVSLDSVGPVEIGTSVKVKTLETNNRVYKNTRNSICTTTYGYFDSINGNWIKGNKEVKVEGDVNGNPVLSCKWNNNDTDIIVNETDLIVDVVGKNVLNVLQSGQIATVDKLPETTVWASTNTKKIIKDVNSTLIDTKPEDIQLTSNLDVTIEGKYKYFIGAYNDYVFNDKVYTTDNVRSNDVIHSDWIDDKYINYKINIPSGTKGMYIAIPSGIDDNGDTLKVKQISTNNFVNDEMSKNKRNLNLNCAGSHIKDYVIFTWSFPGGTIDNEQFEITCF